MQDPAAVIASTEIQKNLPQAEAVPGKTVPTFTDKPKQEQQTVAIPSEYPKEEQVKEQQRSVELQTCGSLCVKHAELYGMLTSLGRIFG